MTNDTGYTQETFDNLKKSFNPRVRAEAAESTFASPEDIKMFITDSRETVRLAAARNPNLTGDLIHELLEIDDNEVNLTLASSPFLDDSHIEVLLEGKEIDTDERIMTYKTMVRESLNASVRAKLASNTTVPTSVLEKLFKDEIESVRVAAVGNPELPVELIIEASRDKVDNVRAAAAGNPMLPVENIVELLQDRVPRVRKNAAGNLNAPSEELERTLRDDVSSEVRVTARKTLALLETLKEIGNETIEE